MTEKDALLLVLGICFWMPERRIERREKQQEAAEKARTLTATAICTPPLTMRLK